MSDQKDTKQKSKSSKYIKLIAKVLQPIVKSALAVKTPAAIVGATATTAVVGTVGYTTITDEPLPEAFGIASKVSHCVIYDQVDNTVDLEYLEAKKSEMDAMTANLQAELESVNGFKLKLKLEYERKMEQLEAKLSETELLKEELLEKEELLTSKLEAAESSVKETRDKVKDSLRFFR